MRWTFALAGLAALAACVEPQATSTVGPTGASFHTAKCVSSPEGCFAKANEICKGPYMVVDSYSKAGGTLADVIPGPIPWYYMSFQCGKSDGAMPQFPHRGPTYRNASTASCTRIGNTVNCYGM